MAEPAAQSPREERLAPPGRKVRALMAAHLRERHQIEPFRPSTHVHLGGPRSASQHLTWIPAKASFHCDLCPGRVFWSGEFTEEMIDRALLFDSGLQPYLAGLATQADRRDMARLYLGGDLNRERLRQLRGADARRRSARGTRPSVERRRARLQPWLLERVRALGVLERVLDEAEAMQRSDPVAWSKLCDRLPSRETMRDWWQDIPPEQRAAAFEAGRANAKKST